MERAFVYQIANGRAVHEAVVYADDFAAALDKVYLSHEREFAIGWRSTYLRELDLPDDEGMGWVISSSDSIGADHIERNDSRRPDITDEQAVNLALRDVADMLALTYDNRATRFMPYTLFRLVSTSVASLIEQLNTHEHSPQHKFTVLVGTSLWNEQGNYAGVRKPHEED